MNKNLGLIITIVSIISGIIFGYARLVSTAEATSQKVVKLEVDTETLKEKISKYEVSQEYITDKIESVEKKIDKVVDILVQQAKKK